MNSENPKSYERMWGPVAVNGGLYKGIAAVGKWDGVEFIVIGANADAVDWAWRKIIPSYELNRSMLQKVVVGNPEKTTPIHGGQVFVGEYG